MCTTHWVKLHPEDVQSTSCPNDVFRTNLYGSMKPRNVQGIRTLYECYITKVVSVAQQVNDTEIGNDNYLIGEKKTGEK